MASKSTVAKGKQQLSHEEVQSTYSRLQNELQQLSSKVGELESEADEHDLVLVTLNEALVKNPDRKCFRLVGGVLVERTVKEVAPALETNRDGIKKIIESLAEQYRTKEVEFQNLIRDYNIRPVKA